MDLSPGSRKAPATLRAGRMMRSSIAVCKKAPDGGWFEFSKIWGRALGGELTRRPDGRHAPWSALGLISGAKSVRIRTIALQNKNGQVLCRLVVRPRFGRKFASNVIWNTVESGQRTADSGQ